MDNAQKKHPVAIITGAARGLGSSTARRLAADGWRIVLFDICADDPSIPYRLATPADMEETLTACRAIQGKAGDGKGVAAVMGDVRRLNDLKSAVGMAVERFGGLDAAVAAAGAIAGGPTAWETTEEIWDTLIDINLRGVWNLARAVVPDLLAAPEPRHGRFIAVSSAAGIRGLPQLAAYSATKHSVIGLVRSIAAELAGSGVTANVVCPGSMDTTMLAASADIYGLSSPTEFGVHHLTNRILASDEVAAFIRWLCSPERSAITGAVLAADGGMTAK